MRANGPQMFRGIFGATAVVGTGVGSLPQMECLLKLSFYSRFILSALFPFVSALIVIAAAMLVQALRWGRSAKGKDAEALQADEKTVRTHGAGFVEHSKAKDVSPGSALQVKHTTSSNKGRVISPKGRPHGLTRFLRAAPFMGPLTFLLIFCCK